VARTIGQKLSQSFGQQFIVENRVGASGAIGVDHVAKSAPDGYTILVNFGPSHHTIQLFTKSVPYNPVKDFTPISIVGTAPQVVVVPTTLPVNTVGELLEYARKNVGKVAYGTSGVGSSQHIGGLMLSVVGNVELTHVAYKGGAAALNDVLGNQIPAAILVLSNVQPHINSGKLRALGVLEAHRARGAPGIQTVAESGVPGFAVPETWAGFLGPAGMQPATVRRLHAEIMNAIENPDVRTRLEAAGFEVGGRSPEAFGELLSTSVEIFRKMITQAGVQPE
jgi:tripartite-type tricarboxylate transporter receptor subunit TctC